MTDMACDVGSGPAVVLLHAFPFDGRMWMPHVEPLASAGWRVLVPHLPGFGTAPLLEHPPTLDAVADALADRLARAGVDRAVVGGVSLGGYVTMAVLRRHPDLVAAAIYCDTKATADAAAAIDNRERIAQRVLAEPDECGRLLEQALLPGLLGDTSRAERPAVVARVRRWLHDAPPPSVAWYQRAMAVRPDSLGTLAGSPRPTIVVWGEEDTLSPRSEQELMLAAAPDSALTVVPKAGHLSLVEEPVVVTEAVLRFLELVRGPRTS